MVFGRREGRDFWHTIRNLYNVEDDGSTIIREEMGAMKIHYTFPILSEEQQELHRAVLLDELQLQAWYVIVCSSMLREEIILPVQ
ncbi:MAG: hypothetical protein WBG01_17810 [Bacteroidota bacterium]